MDHGVGDELHVSRPGKWFKRLDSVQHCCELQFVDVCALSFSEKSPMRVLDLSMQRPILTCFRR